jgi:hypothetical protein
MKLNPCPFCAGEAFFHHNLREMTGENQIECRECGALVCFDVDLDEDEIELAWNTRRELIESQRFTASIVERIINALDEHLRGSPLPSSRVFIIEIQDFVLSRLRYHFNISGVEAQYPDLQKLLERIIGR